MEFEGQSCPMCGALIVDAVLPETHSRARAMKWHLRDDCPWDIDSRRAGEGSNRGRRIAASNPLQPGERMPPP